MAEEVGVTKYLENVLFKWVYEIRPILLPPELPPTAYVTLLHGVVSGKSSPLTSTYSTLLRKRFDQFDGYPLMVLRQRSERSK